MMRKNGRIGAVGLLVCRVSVRGLRAVRGPKQRQELKRLRRYLFFPLILHNACWRCVGVDLQ